MERAPKKVKTVSSTGKVMATVFWDSQIVGGQNDHRTLLSRIITLNCIKNGGIWRRKVFFHHDIAPTYNPIYYTYLYFLFPNWKKSLAGLKFESNERFIAAT